MAIKSSLPIDSIVNIVVNLAAVSATRKQFNLALLIGDVSDDVDFGTNRIKTYDNINAMLQEGFTTEDRLYKAANLIFGQTKTPPKVAIGKINTLKVAGKNTYTVTTNGAADTDTVTFNEVTLTAGTDYEVGESVQETATAIANAFNSKSELNTLYNFTATGDVITVSEIKAGEGNTPGSMTYTGTIVINNGSATISETKKETPLETLIACRQVDSEWYIANYCSDLTDEQIIELAGYIEATTPSTMFAYTTNKSDCLDDEDNIFVKLRELKYRQTIGQYSTTHLDAICAIIGWAMGAMSVSTINSSFTLAYKSEVGVNTENTIQEITSSQVDNIKNNYGNIYINRGNAYDIFEEGRMADGSYFDEIIYLDKYKNDMQLAIMDLLVNNNKISQTESGMTQLKNAIKTVCDDMARVGFIAGGKWLGNDMLELKNGDTLPNGYLIQSEPIDEQTQADRDARKAPPIYVSLKLAGAIHYVTIQVDVNR